MDFLLASPPPLFNRKGGGRFFPSIFFLLSLEIGRGKGSIPFPPFPFPMRRKEVPSSLKQEHLLFNFRRPPDLADHDSALLNPLAPLLPPMPMQVVWPRTTSFFFFLP